VNGAIFFSGQYGSTAQYANWIGEATGLPVFDVKDANADPSKYEFLILGSSVIVYRLTIRKWVKANRARIENKPTILFTVSGAPAGPKLDGWVAASLPQTLLTQMEHVALRGRLNHAEISWWIRMILKMGAWMNTDPQARREELEGFDYVDKSNIEPILQLAEQLRSR
jgi:menaquinone-dependent protoporphyrinogen IX oxidase